MLPPSERWEISSLMFNRTSEPKFAVCHELDMNMTTLPHPPPSPSPEVVAIPGEASRLNRPNVPSSGTRSSFVFAADALLGSRLEPLPSSLFSPDCGF